MAWEKKKEQPQQREIGNFIPRAKGAGGERANRKNPRKTKGAGFSNGKGDMLFRGDDIGIQLTRVVVESKGGKKALKMRVTRPESWDLSGRRGTRSELMAKREDSAQALFSSSAGT